MTSIKYALAEKYRIFKPLLLQIKEHFSRSSDIIHDARNQLKIVPFNDQNIVVKSFRKPNIFNQFIYAYLRDSKAKKSYDHSLKLLSLGITVPDPVGYIEFYGYGVLQESFFLSLHTPYDFTIREVLLDSKWPDHDEIFRQFGIFTQQLHAKGVLHRDYSPGNILITKLDNRNFRFDLVDINRMRFGPLTHEEKMQNLSKLWADASDLSIIARAYAEAAELNPAHTAEAMIRYDEQNKRIKTFKRKLKGAL